MVGVVAIFHSPTNVGPRWPKVAWTPHLTASPRDPRGIPRLVPARSPGRGSVRSVIWETWSISHRGQNLEPWWSLRSSLMTRAARNSYGWTWMNDECGLWFGDFHSDLELSARILYLPLGGKSKTFWDILDDSNLGICLEGCKSHAKCLREYSAACFGKQSGGVSTWIYIPQDSHAHAQQSPTKIDKAMGWRHYVEKHEKQVSAGFGCPVDLGLIPAPP